MKTASPRRVTIPMQKMQKYMRIWQYKTQHQTHKMIPETICLQKDLIGAHQGPTETSSMVLGGDLNRGKRFMKLSPPRLPSSSSIFFSTRTTTSIIARNYQIKKLGKNHDLLPTKYDWYCKTLSRTHAVENKKRGKGQRSRRFVRFTKCTAKINATLAKGTDRDNICLWALLPYRHINTVYISTRDPETNAVTRIWYLLAFGGTLVSLSR